MNEAEIVVADCADHFIDEYYSIDRQGNCAFLITEIQDHGITSPPEQLWYAAAVTRGLQDVANINPQYPLEQFRADFMIDPIGYFVNHPFKLFPFTLIESLSRTITRFVIEIDGFEWHDKTPEQAEQDKRRERIIQQQGFKLFRYAAREVLRDPKQCIAEVELMVKAEIQKACGQLTLKHTREIRTYDKFDGI